MFGTLQNPTGSMVQVLGLRTRFSGLSIGIVMGDTHIFTGFCIKVKQKSMEFGLTTDLLEGSSLDMTKRTTPH